MEQELWGTVGKRTHWASSPSLSFGFLNINKTFNMFLSHWKDCLKRSEGEWNLSPPNLPLCHVDCVELKAIQTLQTQGKLFAAPLIAQNNLD